MDFFAVAVILWGLIIAGMVLFVWGFVRTSKKLLLTSGACLLLPAIILATQQGWYYLFILAPLAAFAAAFTVRK